MRRAAKVDQNHGAVVKALRSVGCSVLDMSRLGEGAPDLLAGYEGCNWLFEVKNPTQPASKRKLKPMQEAFRAAWGGQWAVVESANQAIEIVTMGRRLTA